MTEKMIEEAFEVLVSIARDQGVDCRVRVEAALAVLKYIGIRDNKALD